MLRLNFSFVFLPFPLGRSPSSSCAHASLDLDSRCDSHLCLFVALPSKRSYDFSSVKTKCRPPCNRKFSLMLFFYFFFFIQSDTGATPPESCIFGLMTFITSYAGTSPQLIMWTRAPRTSNVTLLGNFGFSQQKRTKLSQENSPISCFSRKWKQNVYFFGWMRIFSLWLILFLM